MLNKTEIIEKIEHLALFGSDELTKVKALEVLLQNVIMAEKELEFKADKEKRDEMMKEKGEELVKVLSKGLWS